MKIDIGVGQARIGRHSETYRRFSREASPEIRGSQHTGTQVQMRDKASVRNTPGKKFFVTDHVTNGHTDKLTNSMTGCLTDSLTDSVTDNMTSSLTDSTVGRAVNNIVTNIVNNAVKGAGKGAGNDVLSSTESSTESSAKWKLLGGVASSAKPETFNFNASTAADCLRDGLQDRTECGHQIYLLNRYFTV